MAAYSIGQAAYWAWDLARRETQEAQFRASEQFTQWVAQHWAVLPDSDKVTLSQSAKNQRVNKCRAVELAAWQEYQRLCRPPITGNEDAYIESLLKREPTTEERTVKAILVMVEKENTQVHAIKAILDAEKDGQPCAVMVLANGTAVVVNESAASIRAMLAEPVADNRTPAGVAIDGWRATVSADGQPDREIVGIEPLAGACVRTLPTPPAGGRRGQGVGQGVGQGAGKDCQ